jgi:hypothetical protein
MTQILHHAGAFQLNSGNELHDLTWRGMTLVLDPPWLIRSLEARDPGSKARYIDNILPIIYNNVSGLEPTSNPRSCTHRTPWWNACSITASDVVRIHRAVSKELRRARGDPRIVGFYIQDDVLGIFRNLNQDIHRWVKQAGLHRPTICGFSGRLDYPNSPAWMSKIRSYAGDINGDAATGNPGYLANYSPQACDMVALYPYDGNSSSEHAAAAEAATADWTMNKPVWPCDPKPCSFLIFEWTCSSKPCTLLSFYKYALAKRGWTSATPLIGVPQAFGWNNPNVLVWHAPSRRQLASETAAFCRGGAQAIVAWAWHVTAPGSSSPYVDRGLRDGLTAGFKACRAIWNHRHVSIPN